MSTRPSADGPLSALKRLPPVLTSVTGKSTTTPSFKRARVGPGPITPDPSSDIEIDEVPVKYTAVPIRVLSGPMTPSSSTVAFSSSPIHGNNRMMASSSFSSPTKYSFSSQLANINHRNGVKASSQIEVDHDLVLEKGTTFIFGRHRNSSSNSRSSASRKTTSTTLSSSIPKHLFQLLSAPENETSVIHLSKHASHASRVHAAIELVNQSHDDNSENNNAMIRIIVIGQNGMKVRVVGKKRGVRLLQGQKYDLSLNTNQSVELDFFGCKALIRLEAKHQQQQEQQEEQQRGLSGERLFSSSPISQNELRLQSSMPPSSPPVMPADLDDELSELEEEAHREVSMKSESSVVPAIQILAAPAEEVQVEEEEDRQSRQSSPLSPPSEPRLSPLPDMEAEDEVVVEDMKQGANQPSSAQMDINEKSIKAEKIESAISVPTANVKPTSRASSPVIVAPVPNDVDLPAIIASTVVFSGSSKLSLPDLVKHMLESQPSLKDHGSEKTWFAWVGQALQGNKMFGKVERHGKDSSGHPLLPHYYYNPASDPDSSRAKELGALVRPLRTAQRTGGKTIDWRPVGRGRRS
ncbi:uncharacterized protein IL334_005829 [Kwoniella shivajii]|uniref:FHA domain-containing protein n=1 Tax=Kwoniella shivajii TaxID=564305 RepID=A0ABZ1D4W9_9TREE|nr:hypothetical protein IL334_005829 [Kwoniella shivajii]